MDGFGVIAIVVMSATVARSVQLLGFAPARQAMKETGGAGILAMEFLWTRARAAAVLRQWGAAGRRAAVQSLWWDFVFIASYGCGGSLLAWAVATYARDGRGWSGWAVLAFAGMWLVVVAAVLDVVENVALLMLLRGDGVLESGSGPNLPLVASVAALVKWLAVLLAVVLVTTVALLFHAAA